MDSAEIRGSFGPVLLAAREPQRRRADTESVASRLDRATTREPGLGSRTARAGVATVGRRSRRSLPIEFSLSITSMRDVPTSVHKAKTACPGDRRGSYLDCLNRVKSWL